MGRCRASPSDPAPARPGAPLPLPRNPRLAFWAVANVELYDFIRAWLFGRPHRVGYFAETAALIAGHPAVWRARQRYRRRGPRLTGSSSHRSNEATPMHYKLLGRTGLIVSHMCLGTNTFGGERSGRYGALGALAQEPANAIVKRAIEVGINFIDTANVYSQGGSESRVGRAMKDLAIPRDSVVIATKVGLRMGSDRNAVGLSRAHIMAQIDASLARLGTDYVDVYMVHRFDPLTPLEETLRALDDLVRAGKARYLACSNFAAWQVMKGLGISAREGLARFEAVEVHYSIASRDAERELVPMIRDQELGLMIWGPLVGGFLSGKYGRDGKGPGGTRLEGGITTPIDQAKGFDIIDAMRPIAAAHGASIARVALAWLLHQPWVTSVIFGATAVAQVEDNAEASALHLTPDELATLEAASAMRVEYPAWMQKRLDADRPEPK